MGQSFVNPRSRELLACIMLKVRKKQPRIKADFYCMTRSLAVKQECPMCHEPAVLGDLKKNLALGQIVACLPHIKTSIDSLIGRKPESWQYDNSSGQSVRKRCCL